MNLKYLVSLIALITLIAALNVDAQISERTD